MNRARAALALGGAALAALALLSGGSGADPRTPAALPGLPPPFLGTMVLGDGGLSAALDSYGDVVDLRPSPAGPALIEDPADRQAAGTVPANTGIVPRVRIGAGPALAPWRAESVRQGYLPGTNVAVTSARFGRVRVNVRAAAVGATLALTARVAAPRTGGGRGPRVRVGFGENLAGGSALRCRGADAGASAALLCGPGTGRGGGTLEAEAARLTGRAERAGRDWLSRARPLGAGAPRWARALYRRSLLTLDALTDARTGALAAGAREGWAYVWPRDAATAALAYETAGFRDRARRIAGFLGRLDLGAAARFGGGGAPVPGRGPQGDAPGWVAVAARAAGAPVSSAAQASARTVDPTDTPDYQESTPGDYLANAIAQTAVDGPETLPISTSHAHRRELLGRFGTSRGLVRRAGDPGSGLDSAAAWAVRPFSLPALYPAARETLVRLLAGGTPFGIVPGEGWTGGGDPWTAPTAWSAWSFAALARYDRRRRSAPASAIRTARADRRRALRLLGDLRRAATPAGELPERVGARTGTPRSTTPLAWSHAFAILALRELWPSGWAARPPKPLGASAQRLRFFAGATVQR